MTMTIYGRRFYWVQCFPICIYSWTCLTFEHVHAFVAWSPHCIHYTSRPLNHSFNGKMSQQYNSVCTIYILKTGWLNKQITFSHLLSFKCCSTVWCLLLRCTTNSLNLKKPIYFSGQYYPFFSIVKKMY